MRLAGRSNDGARGGWRPSRTPAGCGAERQPRRTTMGDGQASDAALGFACAAGLLLVSAAGCCSSNGECQDGVACNGSEWCNALGLCEPGPPVSCDDGVDCTVGACVEPTEPGEGASCAFVPDDTFCAEYFACNGTERCSTLLGCVVGTPWAC